MSRTIVWSIARTTVLAGVAWLYAGNHTQVEAECYTGCEAQKDYKGECISLKCLTLENEPGKNKCVTAPAICDCNFQGGEPCGDKNE
jgi:hypothetical protein